MVLTDIKRYIRARKQVSLRDLCLRFDSDPDPMRQMLAVWLRKGRLECPTGRVGEADSCGSCNACAGPGPEAELYVWCDRPAPKSTNAAAQAITFFREPGVYHSGHHSGP